VHALEGLVVVDLSQTRVGAQASATLADFGADVIWVEPPGGSSLRRSSAFPYYGRGKQSLVADLRTVEGQARVRDLVAAADVLIDTFRPGVLERRGLAPESLQALNPGLVHASITGFGRQGPYAAVKGYEALVMAKLGVLTVFGPMKDGPAPPYVTTPFASFAATQTTLHGILAALVERDRSGLGQHVDTNLLQGFMTLDTWEWFVNIVRERWPEAYKPSANFDADGVPMSPFTYFLLIALTSDGRWLQFAQVAPHLYQALMHSLGLESTFTDPYWKGNPVFEDAERRVELWNKMLVEARKRTTAAWNEVFDSDPNVFAEQFRRGPEVLDHPQLVHDGFVIETHDPHLGAIRQPGPMVKMHSTPGDGGRRTPELDEHGARPGPRAGMSSTGVSPKPGGDATTSMPLEGITVLELAVLYAAPFGSTLLTDLGARVIKVEAPEGDPIRPMMPFPEVAGVKVMQGKESICIDIGTPEGLELVYQLAERSNLVLQGFRAGVAKRIGVDAASLHARNPRLVYLNAPGYGVDGPYGNRPAYAPSIGAATGIASANVGSSVPEHAAMTMAEIQRGARLLSRGGTTTNAQADGLSADGVATALLLGLVARQRNGEGQEMLSTMLSTCAHAMIEHVIDYEGNPGPAVADDELRGLGALYRVYDASDGWVFLAAPAEHEWSPLCAALARHVSLGTDERFADEASRRVNDAELADVLADVFARRSKDDWERELLAADVGCVSVTTDSVEVMLSREDFGWASGYLTEVEHPTFDRHVRFAPNVRFSRSTTQAKPGQLAGQSTDAVLMELGLDAAAIADLRARKIVV
jgi:crotonobetainyl-CoA:carnitine CoA-transferase CaiB-like acyl-CoA transferase